ncbi:sulfite exporter TauE/SafE family protein [Nocardioides insulae]|uniref:sulfite exporter TauE/SafE family protein n=1 Tax=Nocardioides insulae TaxID=394734 RepID=UPI00041347B0|nr:sulfite exporter TauE/SafE family protein [Nocardioides insulae]
MTNLSILGLSLPALITVALALLAGATVQSLVGLGLGLVAAPVITMVAPETMPDVMLWLAVTYPVLTLAGESRDIDWRGLAWALPPRTVGTVVGVGAVAMFTASQLGVVVGAMVLVAVLLSWRTVRVPLNPGTLIGAGLISGIAGTATSIGGPPLAILYQHRPPREIRTTLAVYFMIGAALSLGALGLSGQLGRDHFLLAVLLSPCLLLGALLSRFLRPRVSDRHVRPAVLLVCGGSALVLLVRSLI